MPPPHVSEFALNYSALEAERAVLGCSLLEAATWPRVRDRLHANDFDTPECREIFQSMCRVDAQGWVPDLVLTGSNAMQPIAGALARCVEDAACLPAQLDAYVDLVRHYSRLRQVKQLGEDLAGGADAERIQEALATALEDAPSRFACPTPIQEVIREVLASLELPQLECVPTPFPMLTHYLSGGFRPGELIYVGARPAVGKTSWGLQLARYAAQCHIPTLVVSREMTLLALGRRLVAQEAKLSATRLKRGPLYREERLVVDAAIARLNIPLWLTDTVVTIAELAEMVTAFPLRFGLIIVDYLQLMEAPRERADRRGQIEAISQALKSLALTARLSVVCLSSLSRPLEGKEITRPTLSRLRESGELEHDADLVIFLHPVADYVECILAKNRDGPTGITELNFRTESVSFDERTKRTAGLD